MSTANAVILIGPPGAGKSVSGRILSERLNRRFADTDALIETQYGLCISDIFSKHGEEYFRQLESNILRKLIAEYSNCAGGLTRDPRELVLATGAGLPITPGNFALMEKLGIIICLTAPPDCLAERLRGDTTRPLLARSNVSMLASQGNTDGVDDYLVDRLTALLKKRASHYGLAHYTIDTATINPAAVAGEMQRILIEKF